MGAIRSETPGAELRARLRERPPKPMALAAWLDGLMPEERVAAIRSTGRADQRRLWHAVEGFAPLRLRDLVPPEVPALATVRHFGRNTLPVFHDFEKRFARPSGEDPESPAFLYGFNAQRLARWTGPGCFLAFDEPERGEVRIDYARLPDHSPDGWPPIRPNDRGLARLVFGSLVDTLRRVSETVSIGSAARGGRDLGSWFLLCREAHPGA